MKKILTIFLVIFVALFFFFGHLYYEGGFKKEEYSGLLIYRVDILEYYTSIESLPIKEEYDLELPENGKLRLGVGSGWVYSIKYYEREKQFPKIFYKMCDFTLYKDGEVYLEDNYDVNTEPYIKGGLVDTSNFFKTSGFSVNPNPFDFIIMQKGKYELVIDLYININDKDLSESKKIIFNIN